VLDTGAVESFGGFPVSRLDAFEASSIVGEISSKPLNYPVWESIRGEPRNQ
jgi:hypothetical protein